MRAPIERDRQPHRRQRAAIAARTKALIVMAALWGVLPPSLATWLIQVLGVTHD